MKTVLSLLLVLLLHSSSARASAPVMQLQADARRAPDKVIHATMNLPVTPGDLTLIFPKYIPGEHGPTGPIRDLTGLQFQVGGLPLSWERDPVDMYRIHLVIPEGASRLQIELDFLIPIGSGSFTSGVSSTPNLFVLNWNQILLYPAGTKADELEVAPQLILPEGWEYGTALSEDRREGPVVQFETVSLETLIDSPVIAGKHFRRVDISGDSKIEHTIDIVSDSEHALDISQEDIQAHQDLVTQALRLFGARHYRRYRFLLTLSDNTAHFGLEHHESSDDRTTEDFFTDQDSHILHAGLLPHEFVHSWNGKYRRPAGIATGDYDTPMKTQMLWVYEGLTTYFGGVLAVRSGLWTEKDYREILAVQAAALAHRTGRRWRNLQDTATAAQILYGGPADRRSWRRGVDFYREGSLIWLEADGLIRKMSQGRRSLDDFARRFFGQEDGVVRVNPYNFDDLTAALDAVQPYDWSRFFRSRLDRTGEDVHLDGLTLNGWKLDYRPERNEYQRVFERKNKQVDEMYSVGLLLNEKGRILDVLRGSPADEAGLAAGMTVIAVDGRAYDARRFRRAVAATPTTGGLTLLVENQEFFTSHHLVWTGGARYPRLTRIEGTADGLARILRPR